MKRNLCSAYISHTYYRSPNAGKCWDTITASLGLGVLALVGHNINVAHGLLHLFELSGDHLQLLCQHLDLGLGLRSTLLLRLLLGHPRLLEGNLLLDFSLGRSKCRLQLVDLLLQCSNLLGQSNCTCMFLSPTLVSLLLGDLLVAFTVLLDLGIQGQEALNFSLLLNVTTVRNLPRHQGLDPPLQSLRLLLFGLGLHFLLLVLLDRLGLLLDVSSNLRLHLLLCCFLSSLGLALGSLRDCLLVRELLRLLLCDLASLLFLVICLLHLFHVSLDLSMLLVGLALELGGMALKLLDESLHLGVHGGPLGHPSSEKPIRVAAGVGVCRRGVDRRFSWRIGRTLCSCFVLLNSESCKLMILLVELGIQILGSCSMVDVLLHLAASLCFIGLAYVSGLLGTDSLDVSLQGLDLAGEAHNVGGRTRHAKLHENFGVLRNRAISLAHRLERFNLVGRMCA